MHLLFLLVLPLFLFAKPIWFYNIKNDNKNEIIGYGVSKDLYEAKKYAIDEIAKSLYLELKSSTKISKKEEKNQFNKKVETNINISTITNLNNIQFIKIEEHEHTWYVAAKYKNSLIQNLVKENLLDKELTNSKQNNYLKNTPLIKLLNESLGKNLNYEIVNKNKKWYLKYDDFINILTQDDFYNLFYNQKNENIKFKLNKKSFEEGELISFEIDTKEEGFISIINIEHDGKIGLLLSNEYINTHLSYPNNNSFNLKIANPYNYPIKEEYLLLFSKNKIDLSEFEIINEKLLDENSFKFDKLIKFLDDKTFLTSIINISKGY